MNKTYKVKQAALERAMRTMGFRDEYEASNYMVGFYTGLLNHLEKSVPGVAKALEVEAFRIKGGGI